MVQAVKITSLNDIGTGIMYTTLVPVVNMTGTPTTEKANLQIVGNLILTGAGGSYFPPAAQATVSQFVAYAAQPNITSVGTLTSLAVTGNITAGNANLGNLAIANVFSGTLNGSAVSANIANTVAFNAQPNITSVGTLTSLNVTGLANLGAVTSLTITGGSPNYVLQTDGFGTLSWVAQSGGNSSYGNSNVVTLLSAFGSNIITTTGNVTANAFIGDGSQLTNIPSAGTSGEVQVNWQGTFSNQGGTPGDTYSTLQFDSNGMPTLNGTNAYQQRVDNSPYMQILAPRVESTDFGIIAGPGLTVVGYDDNYNIPRSAYLSVQDQANATQQWDFGILGNGSNNFSIQDRTGNQTWSFGTDGNINIPGLAFNINYANSESATLSPSVGNSGAVQFNWQGSLSNQGGTPGDTYSTMQFDSDGLLNVNGTTAYQPRVDYTPYVTVNTPRVESTDFGIIAGPGLTVVGYDDNYNIPRSAYLSVQDQANATQQWDFGILGNGNNNFVISDRTNSNQWRFSTNGNLTLPSNTSSINYANGSPYGGGGNANTGNITFSAANISTDLANADIQIIGNGTGDVNVVANSQVWTFNADGNLTIPGNQGSIGTVYSDGIDIIAPIGGYAELASGNLDNFIYVEDSGAYINTNRDTGSGYQWEFDTTGNLTTPGNIFLAIAAPDSSIGSASNVNINAGNSTWSFVAYGNLVLSDGGILWNNYGLTTLQAASDGAQIGSNDGQSYVIANANGTYMQTLADTTNYLWNFDTTGNLTLPGNTFSVNYANGDPVQIGGGGNANTGNITFSAANISTDLLNTDINIIGNGIGDVNVIANGQVWTFGADGNLTTPGNIIVDVAGDAIIGSSSNVNVSAGGNTWAFGTDGNTSFPAVGTANLGNLAIANNFSTNGSGGDITLTGGNITGANVIAANTFLGTGNLHLQPDPANTDAFLDVYLTTGPDIHIVGNGENLILGSDASSNVMIGVDGNVTIQSNTGTPHIWTFGSDGNLTVPGGILGAGNLKLSPNSSNANAYLDIYLTGGPDIHIAGNGESIILGTDAYANVMVNVNGNVYIQAGNANGTHTWNFGTDGNLTLPGNLVINGLANVFGSNVALLQSNPDLPLLSVSSGSNGAVSSLWVEDIGNVGTSNIAAVYANPTSGSKIVRIAVGQNGGNAGPNLWDFNQDGNLTLPYGAVIKDTAGNAVAFGKFAGANTQGNSAVAIGIDAGENNQGFISIAIGAGAGGNGQGQAAVAIGTDTGGNIQGIEAIAIGFKAGNQGQGQQSIAIGAKAGNVNQGNNSIILNATGNSLNQTVANTFTVAPVRNDTSNIAEVMFYNTTSKEVTYGNTISIAGNITGAYVLGNGSQLTGISTSFAGEMHVSKDGNDITGTGTILRPYLTITHALTQVAGGRNTIVIHPGEYTENPTITSTNTQLITYDATAASTIVIGTVTMANVDSRIAGLRMANLIIAGNSQAYISLSTVTGQFTKSSSGYVEVDNCELQVSGNVLISGSGTITIIGNKINNLVVNNAGAAVLVKGADDCLMPQVTAGSLNIVDSVIRASSNTANAVTASAGTVVTLMNNQIVTPAADNVARVSIAGYHSIISLVYDKANSTLSNSLNSVAYFQTANVDSLVSSGNITGNTANITTINSGLLQNGNSNITITSNGNVSIQSAGSNVELVVTSTGANITGTANITGNANVANIGATDGVFTGNISGNTNGFAIGYLNIPQVAAANATLALTDAGKHYYSTSSGNFTLTIPNNSTTTFATGTAISIVVQSAGNILVNAASGVTLYMAGNSTAANRVVSNYGMATIMKVATDTWMINGTGVA